MPEYFNRHEWGSNDIYIFSNFHLSRSTVIFIYPDQRQIPWRHTSSLILIYGDAYECSVVRYVGISAAVELRESEELGTAAGHVHLGDRPLEGGAGRVGAESIDGVLNTVLI